MAIPATVDKTEDWRTWIGARPGYSDYSSYNDSRLEDSLRIYNNESIDLSSALEIEAGAAVASAITDKRLTSHVGVLAFKQGYRARAARESEDAVKRSREHDQELFKQSYNSKQERLMIDDLFRCGNAFYTEDEDGLKTRIHPIRVYSDGEGWFFVKNVNDVVSAKRFGAAEENL